jgi:hypothetical protein
MLNRNRSAVQSRVSTAEDMIALGAAAQRARALALRQALHACALTARALAARLAFAGKGVSHA